MTRRVRMIRVGRDGRGAGRHDVEGLEPRRLLATMFNPDGPTIATLPQGPSSVVAADFDGDGKQDVVLAVGREIRFQKGYGGGRFAAPAVVVRLNSAVGLLGVGNFNEDGRPDLVSVQTGTARGWTRTLLNTGRAQFAVTAYARPWTIVQSVTVGNIDSDPQDEVLLEGRSPWLVLSPAAELRGSIIGEPPDEVRVLDPEYVAQPLGSELPPFFAAVRLADKGVAFTGRRLTAPTIAPLVGGALNKVLVGAQDPDDAANGLVHVLTYVPDAAPAPGLEGEAPGTLVGLLAESRDPLKVQGVPTSIGVAEMNGDQGLDLVVSTLTYPTEPAQDPVGQGDFTARTFVLARTGDAPDAIYGPAQTVHARVLPGEGAMVRAMAPEYRIATLSDMNGDGLADVGLSIVQEFAGGRGGIREARFVQVLRSEVDISGFISSTVAVVLADNLPPSSPFGRPQIFAAADMRGVGRPDLIFADRPGPLGAVKMKVLYNVNATLLVPYPA